MKYYSTNRLTPDVTFKQATLTGLAPDGGLYMPRRIPPISDAVLKELRSMSPVEISLEVARAFVEEEIPLKVLQRIVEETLSFSIPLVPLDERISVLELFHGPTLAFKDVGARFMARVMAYFSQDSDKELTVLVATSGDTGSAVAQGFFGIPGIRVVILYPSGMVSEIQEKQLTTVGGNVTALEIEGTFDDCQRLVKEAFVDPDLASAFRLTSANSINISRLIPQIFYYFIACSQLPVDCDSVVVSVPSGNFGNLTAGVMGQQMGLPIRQFIAATNVNDTVPRYLRSGVYQPKSSVMTISNAMDVGNPSNFARMQELCEGDLQKMRDVLWGKAFTDEQTREAIGRIYADTGYLVGPHGAVGYLGLCDYFDKHKEHSVAGQAMFLATAHAAKFLDIMQPLVEDPIELPERLRLVLEKPKVSIPLSRRFEDLKSWLFSVKKT